MPDCIELQPVESIDDNNLVLYYRHHTPWPVRTRDAVLHVNTVLDTVNKTLFIQSNSIEDDRFPAHKNAVRMTEMAAKWKIQYIDENHTRIIYQFRSDPGGLIPESQIGRFTQHLPAKTLMGLSNMITLSRYIEMAKTSEECRIVDKFSTNLKNHNR